MKTSLSGLAATVALLAACNSSISLKNAAATGTGIEGPLDGATSSVPVDAAPFDSGRINSATSFDAATEDALAPCITASNCPPAIIGVDASDAADSPDGAGQSCTKNSDCPLGLYPSLDAFQCAFPIAAGCTAAVGVCVLRPGGIACADEKPACTCAGTTDSSPQCGLDGSHATYAWEPIAHAGPCLDGDSAAE
jgi:hypothetical protein